MNDLDTILESVASAGSGRNYTPTAETAAMLNQALTHVQSVPYAVSLRWVEYRLLQTGVFASKADFTRFKELCTTARKRFWGGWNPGTLADDTRKTITRGQGHTSVESWLDVIVQNGVQCNLDFWADRENYVELWFEAEAMQGQFEFYTKQITLRPFKGDPGVHCKWTIAQYLKKRRKQYPKQRIVILYFGDLDKKGLQIPKSAVRDIRLWCDVDFDFIRAGLNPEHPALYNIEENPERPGCYQWEALDDESARQLITSAVSKYVDTDWIEEREQEQSAAEKRLQLALCDIKNEW